MRVRFERDVLDAPDRFGRDANAIIDTCATGQHSWVIDDLDDVLTSSLVRDCPSWDPLATLAEKTWRAAIDEPTTAAHQRLVVVKPAGTGVARVAGTIVCTAASARQLLARPLYLVLENATSDWSFVRALVKSYRRTALDQAIANHWIVPDQAGGSGEFVKRVRGLIEQGIESLRIVALMDSDRLAPGALPPAVDTRVKALEGMGATVIVLHKREVENYLPTALLDGKATNAVRVSWLALTRVQQDHYDMKFGFATDSATSAAAIPLEQKALFAGSNPWHLDRLIGGFGKRIGDRFENAHLDLDDLAVVCATCPDELAHVLDVLEAAL